jgi:PTH1 family peptidyl-tRNA hydrolase
MGFRVIDALASYFSIKLKDEGNLYKYGRGKISGEEVILAEPLTYMNKSGDAVSGLLRYYKVLPADLIVIYDDIDLEAGQLKVKSMGGSGGHKGCASVISSIGTEDFLRIRVGIGRPPPGRDVVGYVLSEFTSSEISVVENAVECAADAVRMVVSSHDPATVMNKYN